MNEEDKQGGTGKLDWNSVTDEDEIRVIQQQPQISSVSHDSADNHQK
jgi:hypothetical protein